MDNREANSLNHPPACTCVDCVKRRMERLNVRYSDEIEPQKNDGTETKPIIENKPKKISRFSFVKLVINLLIIASFVGIAYTGYLAFNHKMNPVAGTIWFIVSIVVFVCLIKLTNSRQFNWRTPSFAITFWSVVGITLVATFAGIQPLSHYKDELFNKISSVSATTKTAQPQNTTTGNLNTSEVTHLNWAVIPAGYYISDDHKTSRTLTVKGTTITMNCQSVSGFEQSWPQLGTHTYGYKVQTVANLSEPVSLSEANYINLTDVVNGSTYGVGFKYLSDYNIIMITDETGNYESFSKNP